MDLILQIWAGLFYLLNKIFLAFGESKQKKYWRIIGWSCYLVGLPAWVIIFIVKHNWIAAALETGGAPAMIFGLIIAIRGFEKTPKLLDKVAKYSVYSFVLLGVGYSFYDYSGLTSITQVLEILIVVGYLFGTYFIARRRWTGWLWFILMNLSCAALMGIHGKYILAIQQCISLIFVVYGSVNSYKFTKKSAS